MKDLQKVWVTGDQIHFKVRKRSIKKLEVDLNFYTVLRDLCLFQHVIINLAAIFMWFRALASCPVLYVFLVFTTSSNSLQLWRIRQMSSPSFSSAVTSPPAQTPGLLCKQVRTFSNRFKAGLFLALTELQVWCEKPENGAGCRNWKLNETRRALCVECNF